MHRSTAFLTFGLAVCFLAAGCGRGITAAEIAEDYGILNRCDLQKDTAKIIQAGLADKMIANGQARVRTKERTMCTSFGNTRRVLITEYLIDGEPYRIEVRRAINPVKDIPLSRVNYSEAKRGVDHRVHRLLSNCKVYDTLKDHSYEATAEVAYRAWRGLDGSVHPVVVTSTPTPDWTRGEKDVVLTLHTDDTPMVTMWVRGLTSDGRREDADWGGQEWAWDGPRSEGENFQGTTGPGGMTYSVPFSHETQGPNAPDGRWILENPGPGAGGDRTVINGRSYFVNLKLYEALGLGTNLQDS